MFQFILWYLTISVLGLLSFPLVYRLFPALADRGYSLSRALGLLIWAFVFWLSVSLGLARNDIGGLLFALAVLVGLSVWALNGQETERVESLQDTDVISPDAAAPRSFWETIFDLRPVLDWLKTNLRLVISIEAIFLVAFAAWAFVRANNPEMTSAGGEKWMEVAFINAILHSPTFPPHDPWLSGYGISYYYFGYVMTAMLAMVTATIGSVAHNLMLSLVFALSVIGSYGLLYNLLCAYWGTGRNLRSLLGAFFAPIFLVLMGNVEGFLELLHAYGIGWTNTSSNFWLWLNMKDLSDAPVAPFTWAPRFWFWWRASRVVHDYDLRGNFTEIIDEFPFFSYLLGDLHPHVLAMPFGLLAAALALNLYLGGWKGVTNIFGFKMPLRKEGLALMAVVLGGLAFLNTWDFPVYLALVSGAFLLAIVNERGWGWGLLEDFFKFAIPVGLASIVLYLPFYVGFSSQAGGILPNVIFPTRGAYLWIMFGTLLVPLFIFLISLFGKRAAKWKIGFLLMLGVTLVLWVFSTVLGVFASQTDVGRSFITAQGLTSTWDVLFAATQRRLEFGAGLLTLIVLVGVALAYLAARRPQQAVPETDAEQVNNLLPFVLMFIVFGGLLVLAPEFVYLRDQFGSRMNTVFKFYYQAWAFWSLAAAFGVVVLIKELNGLKLVIFSVALTAVLGIGLTYPLLALPNKTDNFDAADTGRRTLDGAAYLNGNNPDDYSAIQWLSQLPLGTVVEAVGGSYSEFARVSTYSGQPAVLGWPQHESQWRGGYTEMGSRQDDIARLYTTNTWSDAQAILQQYDIRYVYIGTPERTTYVVDELKFSTNLPEVYRQGSVVIYQVP